MRSLHARSVGFVCVSPKMWDAGKPAMQDPVRALVLSPEATSTVYSLRDPYLWTPWRDAPRPRHHSMGSRFATVLRFTENLEKLELKSRAISLKPGPKSATITGDAVFDPNHPGTHSWASHGFSAWLINPQYLLHLNFSTGQSPESCPRVNHTTLRSFLGPRQKAAQLQSLRTTYGFYLLFS